MSFIAKATAVALTGLALVPTLARAQDRIAPSSPPQSAVKARF